VKAVGLTTFDEEEYRIDPEIVGIGGLKDHLREHVRLTTVVRGDRVLQVRRIELLGNSRSDSGTPDDASTR